MWPHVIGASLRAHRTGLSTPAIIAAVILVLSIVFFLLPVDCFAQGQLPANPQQQQAANTNASLSVNNDGHLEGDDVSVGNGPGNAPGGGIGVANGSIVVVHSGCAR